MQGFTWTNVIRVVWMLKFFTSIYLMDKCTWYCWRREFEDFWVLGLAENASFTPSPPSPLLLSLLEWKFGLCHFYVLCLYLLLLVYKYHTHILVECILGTIKTNGFNNNFVCVFVCVSIFFSITIQTINLKKLKWNYAKKQVFVYRLNYILLYFNSHKCHVHLITTNSCIRCPLLVLDRMGHHKCDRLSLLGRTPSKPCSERNFSAHSRF